MELTNCIRSTLKPFFSFLSRCLGSSEHLNVIINVVNSHDSFYSLTTTIIRQFLRKISKQLEEDLRSCNHFRSQQLDNAMVSTLRLAHFPFVICKDSDISYNMNKYHQIR